MKINHFNACRLAHDLFGLQFFFPEKKSNFFDFSLFHTKTRHLSHVYWKIICIPKTNDLAPRLVKLTSLDIFVFLVATKSQGMISQTAFLVAPHKRYSSLPLLLKTIGVIAMM